MLTARLPVNENVGRLIRSMAWLSYTILNNGAGFQDSDGLIGGKKHTYVAAVEVTVAGSTYTSTPQIAHITPEIIHEAVADDRLSDSRGQSLHRRHHPLREGEVPQPRRLPSCNQPPPPTSAPAAL